MISSFRSKALERLWFRGETKHFDGRHVRKLIERLTALDGATRPEDMNLPGYGFHGLIGDQKGRYSVKIDKNWRLTFGWSHETADAIDVDYEDYH